MLFRAIALSLALLLGITALVPFMTNSAEAIPKNVKKKKKKLKKYSKAWWRWYHKEKRRKRALSARKRALKARQILRARQSTNKVKPIDSDKKITNPIISAKENAKTIEPSQNKQNDLQFPVNDNNGKSLGTVQLSVVGQATAEAANGLPKIGGVSTTSLRRNVVDKMAKEEGWVVNDYHKIVNGKKVYVVVAQTSVKGVVQSRLFYFTEVDGKIYSLATISPNEAQERIAMESEKVIQSLQQGNYIAQNALQK
jgi:hypothetical protein